MKPSLLNICIENVEFIIAKMNTSSAIVKVMVEKARKAFSIVFLNIVTG